MSTAFFLENRHGDPIRGNVHVPASGGPWPVLVIVHGFKGFKDWGPFPAIAEQCARDGFCTVRFNFSLNGIGEDGFEFTQLENFRRNTYTREHEDLQDLLSAMHDGRMELGNADLGRLALLGHSRGGGQAILTGADDARVHAVASWASVCTFDRWGAQLKAMWRERGVLEILNQRTKQKMPLGVGLLDDFESHRDALDILQAVSRLRKPLLIVHGDADVSVPLEEARALFAAADGSRTELVVIPAADHVFGAAHPFMEMPDTLASVLERTMRWMKSQLSDPTR